MTTDPATTLSPSASLQATNNQFEIIQPELATLDAQIKQYQADIQETRAEANEFILTEEQKPNRLQRRVLKMIGDDPDFVKKEEFKDHIPAATALAFSVGLGTIAFTKYITLKYLGTTSIPSLSIPIGIAATAGILWWLDRGLIQSIENWKVSLSKTFKEKAAALEGDLALFKQGLSEFDSSKAVTESKSFLYTLATLPTVLLPTVRLGIMGGGATLTAVAAADAFFVGDEVTTAARVDFDAQNIVVDPKDGITTQAEVIQGVHDDVTRMNNDLASLQAEKLQLEKQISGSILTDAEQNRINELNQQIAVREMEKSQAMEQAAKHQAEMVNQDKGGTGAIAGKGTLYNKAKADLAVQETIIAAKQKAIDQAEATKSAIIESAQTRAESAKDTQIETATRDRLTTVNAEIKKLQSGITERADVEAFARKSPDWPEFNPEGFQRFNQVVDAVWKSGGNVLIGAGMVGGVVFVAESSAILQKLAQKQPHNSTVRKLLARQFEDQRDIKIQLLGNAIENIKAKKAVLYKDATATRFDMQEAVKQQATIAERLIIDLSRRNQQIMEDLLKGDESGLVSLSQDEKKHIAKLAQRMKQSVKAATEAMALQVEIDTLVGHTRLKQQQQQVLQDLATHINKADQAALEIINGSQQTYDGVSQAVRDARDSLKKALSELGDSPEVAPLKTALSAHYAKRLEALGQIVGQSPEMLALPSASNDSRPEATFAAAVTSPGKRASANERDGRIEEHQHLALAVRTLD